MEHPEAETPDTYALPPVVDYGSSINAWKEFVKELKTEWKHLWWTRIDDKVRAEGIASDEFPRLFIEKGTIIIATKDYKPPSFHEILTKYMPEMIYDQINPSPHIGGLGKFIREFITKQRISRREPPPKPKKDKDQQRKHGGRGWLHYAIE